MLNFIETSAGLRGLAPLVKGCDGKSMRAACCSCCPLCRFRPRRAGAGQAQRRVSGHTAGRETAAPRMLCRPAIPIGRRRNLSGGGAAPQSAGNVAIDLRSTLQAPLLACASSGRAVMSSSTTAPAISPCGCVSCPARPRRRQCRFGLSREPGVAAAGLGDGLRAGRRSPTSLSRRRVAAARCGGPVQCRAKG